MHSTMGVEKGYFKEHKKCCCCFYCIQWPASISAMSFLNLKNQYASAHLCKNETTVDSYWFKKITFCMQKSTGNCIEFQSTSSPFTLALSPVLMNHRIVCLFTKFHLHTERTKCSICNIHTKRTARGILL